MPGGVDAQVSCSQPATCLQAKEGLRLGRRWCNPEEVWEGFMVEVGR